MKQILQSILTAAAVFMLIVASGCCSCRREAEPTDAEMIPKEGMEPALSKAKMLDSEDAAEPPDAKSDTLTLDHNPGAPSTAMPSQQPANTLAEQKEQRQVVDEVRRAKGAPSGQRSNQKPFWVVEKFTEKKTWLSSQPAIKQLNREWGNELTQSVRKALAKRSLTVESVSEKLTEKQITQLASEGMKYLCGGSLQELTQTDDNDTRLASLSIIYELKRSSGNKTRLVQKERLSFSLGIAGKTISEADLQSLIETAANAIAGRIVEHIPSDLAASRG